MKLNKRHQSNIASAIASAERETSAEIAWKVVDRSSSYSDAPWIWSVLLLTATGFFQLANGWNGGYGVADILLADLAVCLVAGFALAKVAFLRRLVISDARMKRRVTEKAQSSFFTGGVHLTRQHNGALIYISVLERRVVIVIDKAIVTATSFDGANEMDPLLMDIARLEKASWLNREMFVWDVMERIKRLGDYLKEYFPPKPGDRNEVPDLMV